MSRSTTTPADVVGPQPIPVARIVGPSVMLDEDFCGTPYPRQIIPVGGGNPPPPPPDGKPPIFHVDLLVSREAIPFGVGFAAERLQIPVVQVARLGAVPPGRLSRTTFLTFREIQIAAGSAPALASAVPGGGALYYSSMTVLHRTPALTVSYRLCDFSRGYDAPSGAAPTIEAPAVLVAGPRLSVDVPGPKGKTTRVDFAWLKFRPDADPDGPANLFLPLTKPAAVKASRTR